MFLESVTNSITDLRAELPASNKRSPSILNLNINSERISTFCFGFTNPQVSYLFTAMHTHTLTHAFPILCRFLLVTLLLNCYILNAYQISDHLWYSYMICYNDQIKFTLSVSVCVCIHLQHHCMLKTHEF